MADIKFFSEDIDFDLPQQPVLGNWIIEIFQQESGKKLKQVHYVFCSDRFLVDINRKFLHHDTLTDIITFDLSEKTDNVEAEIYISIPRVRENSKNMGIPFQQELHRVMIHGILHLAGYDDQSADEKRIMRIKENECLNLLNI